MRILSLNLCVSWIHPRGKRLRAVADYVLDNRVDVVLLQEGIRSCLIYDSLRQLNGMLGGWNLWGRSPFGWPFFWEFRLGIISRYRIIRSSSAYLEVAQSEWVDAIPLPGRRRAVMVQVDVPDLGIANLISVHLTSSPKTEQARGDQYSNLLTWINSLPPADVTILGGDFNLDLDNPCYKQIMLYGFEPVAMAPPDYIFLRGSASCLDRQRVFQGHFVSDHEGLIAEFGK
jgi:endonuclease/exonuclease/phosphatase family metal-dependent hydrolase